MVLDSLEDSVSLILIFSSLTFMHVVRIRVLLVLFHLIWFLFYFVLFDTDPFGEILIHLVEILLLFLAFLFFWLPLTRMLHSCGSIVLGLLIYNLLLISSHCSLALGVGIFIPSV